MNPFSIVLFRKAFNMSAIMILTVHMAASQITFNKSFGDWGDNYAYSVRQTSDGGYILTGKTTEWPLNVGDALLVKTDSTGDTLWTKKFGGANDEAGFNAFETMDGGYILSGTTNSFGVSFNDMYLVKTDSIGNMLWSKTYGYQEIGASCHYDYCFSTQQTWDGGYILTGTGWDNIGNSSKFILIKTDANGDTLWTRCYGGITDDVARTVYKAWDGFVILGYTMSFGVGSYDILLIKTDFWGNFLWSKTFGGISQDYGYSIQQTFDGGFIIAGCTFSFGAGAQDAYLIKTDYYGNLIWSKVYGGPGGDLADYVYQTADSGYVFTGTYGNNLSSPDAYLIRTDASGDTLWTRTYGDPYKTETGISVQQTNDGGFIISGRNVTFLNPAYDFKSFLIKTDSMGISDCFNSQRPTTVTIPATQESGNFVNTSWQTTHVGTPPTLTSSGIYLNGSCSSVGLNETETTAMFYVYPNPAHDVVRISFEIIPQGNIEIYNEIGQLVLTEAMAGEQQKEINLFSFPAGIYLLKVFDGNRFFCERLVKACFK